MQKPLNECKGKNVMCYDIELILSSLPYHRYVQSINCIRDDNNNVIGFIFRVQYVDDRAYSLTYNKHKTSENFNIMYPHFMKLLGLTLGNINAASPTHIEYTFWLGEDK